jgi:hypothetical protein
MVRRLLVIAGLVATSALAAPTYQLDRKTIALGEAVTLTVTAKPGTLDKVDLTRLAQSCEILNRNLGRDKNTETLTLTLYPRQSGRLDLAIPGIAGRAPLLEVSDGSKDVPRVHFRVETQPATYHARQPVRLTLEACDSGGLMWTRPPLPTREGILVRTLGEDEQEAERNGERCTAHRWHWAMTPTAAGTTTLPLPVLEANKLGRRLRFAPPPVQLQAQPIPAWLPAEAAIGKPVVTVNPLPVEWPIERPLAWRIDVNGGYSTAALKSLLMLQLATQPQLTTYPPTIEFVASESATPRYTVTLYLLAHTRGPVELPELVFPWYDPATDALQQVRHGATALRIVDPAWQFAMQALLLLATMGAATGLAYLVHRTQAWRWRRHVASARLASAVDVADLAQRLRGFSLHGVARVAPTLGEWQSRMRREATIDGIAELVAAVELSHYGTTSSQFDALKTRACDALRRARPR